MSEILQAEVLDSVEHIGYFNDEIEAANAYDCKALELFGEYANINFPDFNVLV